MNILITICARGGSKGIPGKNIKEVGGKPLIEYSIKTANIFSQVNPSDIVLSTDSPKIKEVAANCGLFTDYIRPESLSSDTTGKIDTIKDVLNYQEKKTGIKYDYILDLDVTSPLRTIEDLENAFKIIREDPEALNIFSVSPAHRNPYFNMVEKGDDGYYKLIKTPKQPIKSRQTAPVVFDLNASFYFYRRIFFDFDFQNAYTSKSLVYVVPHVCFDLDEPIDFLFMEYLIANNKLDFDFSESCNK